MAYEDGYSGGYAYPFSRFPAGELSVEFDEGVWTDLWADVVDLSTRRGRNRELGAYETGTLVVTLRNDARQYDPDYAAGAYYGKLRPNRRLRFRATYEGVTYPVFVGYIDRITQNYGGPNDATATIEVSDRFKILNRVELPSSVYAATIASAFPDLWYRLDEAAGSAGTLNSGTLGSDYNGTWESVFPSTLPDVTGPELGAAALVVLDPGTAVQTGDDVWAINKIPATFSVDQTMAFAVEAWVQVNDMPTVGSHTFLFRQEVASSLSGALIGLFLTDDGGGNLIARFGLYNSAGTPYVVETAGFLGLGVTYHIVGRHDSDGTLHIFVDGADVTMNAPGSAGTTAAGTYTKVAGTNVAAPYWLGHDSIIDEVAIYTAPTGEAINAATISDHHWAGRDPWDSDSPGLRASRILSLAGVPILDYDLDTGAPLLQATTLGGTALAYLQKIEETVLGAFFAARDGVLRFIGRDELVTEYTASSATLVDHTGGGLPYRFSSADVDEGDLITRAAVSREGSIAVAYQDDDAIAEFQIIDVAVDGLLHRDDDYSASYAQWLVNTHKEPRSRLGAVTLDLAHTPTTMYPGILDLELADRATYVRQPQNVGTAITQDMRVDSIAHSVSRRDWRTTLQLSPLNPGEAGNPVWVWDTTEWDEHVWGMG